MQANAFSRRNSIREVEQRKVDEFNNRGNASHWPRKGWEKLALGGGLGRRKVGNVFSRRGQKELGHSAFA